MNGAKNCDLAVHALIRAGPYIKPAEAIASGIRLASMAAPSVLWSGKGRGGLRRSGRLEYQHSIPSFSSAPSLLFPIQGAGGTKAGALSRKGQAAFGILAQATGALGLSLTLEVQS